MMAIFKISLFCFLGLSIYGLTSPAQASSVTYKSDPVFAPINEVDQHPLQGLFDLAHEGDPRAQYILGDLFAKGKGGISKDQDKARLLFEHSAKGGTPQAFIRLAALAKVNKNYRDAYMWYHLSIDRQKKRNLKNWSKRQLKELLDTVGLSSEDKRQARKDVKAWKIAKLTPLQIGRPEHKIPTPPSPKPEAIQKTALNDIESASIAEEQSTTEKETE